MKQVYNLFQVSLWFIVLCSSLSNIMNQTYLNEYQSIILKIAQCSQIVDIMITPSIIIPIGQLITRLLILFVFMDSNNSDYGNNLRILNDIDYQIFYQIVISWSLAEIIRFSYYLNTKNESLKYLRYSCFVFLYPIGVSGELRCIWNYIHKQQIDGSLFIVLIGYMIFTVFGMVLSGRTLLKTRNRIYKNKTQ